MSKFKTPNGSAFITVRDHQDDEMINRGMIRVIDRSAKTKGSSTNDKTVSKKPKDSAKKKAISEVETGEVRTS